MKKPIIQKYGKLFIYIHKQVHFIDLGLNKYHLDGEIEINELKKVKWLYEYPCK